MSIDICESALQNEKLPPFGCSTSLSVDGHLSNSVNREGKESEALSATESHHLLQKCETQENESEIDPDTFYSWLRPPFDGMAIGKKSKNNSETSISSSSSSSLPVPTPPDGGWGWLVVLGAFSVSLICDGLSYCFGVLYAELLEQFGESRSKTSLVGSIFFGVAMILGPFSSALTTRFGSRTMTITGGLLACFGMILSHFATSIEMLCFTFSVIVGTGFSFCYISSVVIVSFYFDKRRSLATGLAVCGTGVGTVTFAPLMDYLITEYGMRGLFLIMAGISLNLVVCGMLFRPLQFTESERWEMLLEEFNKIPYSREDIELGRSRYPSESSTHGSDEDEEEDVEARTLSVLSLPTFVSAKLMDIPSDILMEALKTSRNPHLTLQRYMKNAMLHINDVNEQKALLQDQGDGDYNNSNSLKGNDEVKIEEAIESLPSSLIDDTILKLAQSSSVLFKSHPINGEDGKLNDKQSKANHVKSPGAQIFIEIEPFGKETHPMIKDPAGGKVEAKVKDDTKSKPKRQGSIPHDDSKPKPVDTKQKMGPHRREFSGMSSMLTDKGCVKEGVTVVKRVGGVHIGRHNALGIHLPLYRTDIFYRRLLKNNSLHKNCTLATSCPELSEAVVVEAERNFLCKMFINFFEESMDILKSMVEFQLFCNPFFIVFVLSNFIYYFWSDVPYMYAADHAMDNKVDARNASFLLSIIGIFNTIGQVVFGIVGDLNINLQNVYAIVSSLAGLFVAIIPFMTTYVNMCIGYSLFGFCISVSFPLTTVLLIRFLGVSKLTNAYGLLMLMQGIANFLGPPFAGWVSDRTGNYNSTFYMSGFFYAVSGLVLFLTYIPKCQQARSRRHSLDLSMEIKVDEPVVKNEKVLVTFSSLKDAQNAEYV
ncbi:uncharacterized protein LOC131954120 [Physella acuta]|uniref:uncharacterized protein LOC131954120 n=1 Tax=Physella acuta TaxID=109671 RepID=UPI0027DE3170|nr:uncharacterized protein LOC131954120 [Physella acuta]